MNDQRYEKEIEEILKNAGEKPPEKPWHGPDDPPPRRSRKSSPSRGAALRNLGISYKGVLLAGIVLLLISAILGGGLYVFFAGVALLVAGYVMYYRAPRSGAGSPGAPKMWRGRTIEPGEPPPPGRWRRRR